MNHRLNYWSQFTRTRIGRRKAIVTSGGLAASALFLAACGGDDDETGGTSGSESPSSPATGSQGLVDTPSDSTSDAKPGGVLKHWQDGDPVHFDALASNAHGVINFGSAFAYPRMLRFVTPKYPKEANGSLEGEIAESFELSKDKLQLTFKIRQGMKWDARAPTSGRPIDAEDVVFSWNKFAELNQSAGNMAFARSPAAPIESVTATDSKTVVMKMHHPDASLLALFAAWDHFYVMPRESDGGFDPRTEVRGHGPWILEEWEPSVRIVWSKNPDYFLKGRPFPDRMERPTLPEYATRLAQFKAGNIHTPVALPNDILRTKQENPGTSIRQEGAYSASISNFLSFGYEDDSPFVDARVRQAVSMMLDREAYVDVIDNRDKFSEAGIDLPSKHNTIVAAGFPDYWLDPQDESKFGPNHKFLKLDPAEAKKLLTAAGHPDGITFEMFFSSTLYGAAYIQSVELIAGMLANDASMKVLLKGTPYEIYKDTYYEAYYGPSYASGKTKGFNGLIHLANPALPTVAAHLGTFVHKDGGRYHGMSPDGKNAHLGDPKLNSDIEDLKLTFDRDEQISKVHDFTRYFTQQAYYIPRPAQVKPLLLIWPALGNFGVFQPSPSDNQWAEENVQWWIDETKAPYV